MTTTLARAAVLGLATGSRSTLGLSALALSNRPRRPRRWWKGPWPRRGAALASVGELVGDKLPQTPSRLEPAGFVPRLFLGGVAGGLLSHREGRSRGHQLFSVAAGSMAAAVGAQVGASWRTLAADQFGHDLPGALAEDAVAITAATVAVRFPS